MAKTRSLILLFYIWAGLLLAAIICAPKVYAQNDSAKDLANNQAKSAESQFAEEDFVGAETYTGRYAKYQELYGANLSGVPFAVRYAFQNDKGEIWEKASFDQRAIYIANWDKQEKIKQKEERNLILKQERAERQIERAKLTEKGEEDRRIKLEERQKEMEKKEEERKKKIFDRKVEEQKKELERLRKLQDQKHNN